MKAKQSDFTKQMIDEICDILNKGNECHIKRERENIVIVKVERECISKNPMEVE